MTTSHRVCMASDNCADHEAKRDARRLVQYWYRVIDARVRAGWDFHAQTDTTQ
jgi:hypothetical protein